MISSIHFLLKKKDLIFFYYTLLEGVKVKRAIDTEPTPVQPVRFECFLWRHSKQNLITVFCLFCLFALMQLDFCHFSLQTKPKGPTFVCKYCWSELWPEFATIKLSAVTWLEIALKPKTWLRKTFPLSVPGVKVSAEPIHQDTVVNVSLLFRRRTTGRRLKRTLTITHRLHNSAPSRISTAILQQWRCWPKSNPFVCRFFFSVVRPFLFLLWLLLLSLLLCIGRGVWVWELRATFTCWCRNLWKGLICNGEEKEDCRLGWCVSGEFLYFDNV